ncbi:hypothetical protein YC2023_019737 [Brassica napus]|uniref:(rape) hypothetical protein n=1 Tax=Brassica napus TaxID=3708 RepID=A0A816KU08_BRANA|nr:unnamed protein product [Brassica napus]
MSRLLIEIQSVTLCPLDLLNLESEKLHCLIPAPKAYMLRLSLGPKSIDYVPYEEMTANKRLRSECEEFISPCNSYALSIVLIGVGDGRWEDMRKFDDNIPKREFDNFQIMKRDSSESAKEAAFALAALMEIPFQYQAATDSAYKQETKEEESVRKVVREEEKGVLLLDNDSGGSYKAAAHEKDGDNAPFHESDDNSSTWYDERKLLWAPSSPQKLKIGIVLSKGQLPGGHTVIHGPFVSLMLYQRHALRGTLKKHLITASYVDDETSMLHDMTKNAWITVLGETTSHNSVNLTWPLV